MTREEREREREREKDSGCLQIMGAQLGGAGVTPSPGNLGKSEMMEILLVVIFVIYPLAFLVEINIISSVSLQKGFLLAPRIFPHLN